MLHELAGPPTPQQANRVAFPQIDLGGLRGELHAVKNVVEPIGALTDDAIDLHGRNPVGCRDSDDARLVDMESYVSCPCRTANDNVDLGEVGVIQLDEPVVGRGIAHALDVSRDG